MKVAFDANIFARQEYGGISRYFCNLAGRLSEYKEVDCKVIAPLYVNSYLENLPKESVLGVKIPKIPKVWVAFHLFSLWLGRKAIKNFNPEIVHETYYASLSSAPKNARVVVTVYDMIHELFPSMFSKYDRTSKLKRRAILRADHIICISENTRRDLLDFLPIAPEKVSVIYLGFDKFTNVGGIDLVGSLLMKKPYLLYVGQRSGYKNFNKLLQAYASSNRLKQNFRIVCVGGKKLQVNELNLINELGITGSQVMQTNADDDLLAELYRNAAAFIFPSLYEGFGIPPLEAMSLRCPVICSNTSSIPEVVGDAGEYFDPLSTDSIREAIERVLDDEERRGFLIKKGMERCQLFSWERCVSETLDVYRNLI